MNNLELIFKINTYSARKHQTYNNDFKKDYIVPVSELVPQSGFKIHTCTNLLSLPHIYMCICPLTFVTH